MTNCVICGRILIEGPSADKHHFTPKSEGGKETITIHKICHSKIHSLFTEKELALNYNTAEKLLTTREIQKFLKWVIKKDPEFYERSKRSKSKYLR